MDASAVSQVLSATADLLRSLAWPLVASAALVRFTPELRNLLHRLRKGGGAEFDPPAQQLASRAPELPAAGVGATDDAAPLLSAPKLPAAVPFDRTPAIVGWEATIRQLPALQTVSDSSQREEILVNSMARMMLTYVFDITELLIYGSQIELLAHLNVRSTGDSTDSLRQLFFEPAKRQYPAFYETYSFENYIEFLRGRGFVEAVAGSMRIASQGREYLAWRVAMNKPPRQFG